MPEARTMGADKRLYGRRRDGSDFAAEITLNPCRSDRAVFVVASVVDLTARRELEQAASLAVDQKLEFEQLIAESVHQVHQPAARSGDRGDSRRDPPCRPDRSMSIAAHFSGFLTVSLSWSDRMVGPSGRRVVAIDDPLKERFPWVRETILAGNVLSLFDAR